MTDQSREADRAGEPERGRADRPWPTRHWVDVPRNPPVACSLLAGASHAGDGGGTIDSASRTRSIGAIIGRATTLVLLLLLAPASAWAGVGDGVLGSTGDAGAPRALAVAQPSGAVPGIDVSHWQETIDWAQVAASGKRFAIAKATDGQSYVDPMYAINKAGAELNGLVFGAYHFARPDRTASDAVIEADHFVDVAQLEPGNLIPVLDIEKNPENMSQAEITTWILTWLDRVTERLGVRPMVYTSPNGWLNRTGDTTAVVDAGYTVLWVAHWGVSEPTAPAGSWGGYGWTFWQYTSDGAVPGIQGRVDLDWYETSSFDPVTIPSADVVGPSASISLPTTFGDRIGVTFSEVVHNVTPHNTFVWAPVSGTYPKVDLTCRA